MDYTAYLGTTNPDGSRILPALALDGSPVDSTNLSTLPLSATHFVVLTLNTKLNAAKIAEIEAALQAGDKS